MYFINKLKKFYTIIFIIILFLNTILVNDLSAVSFKISEIEVSEQFDLKFNKKKVFDKAFKRSFSELTSMITTISDKKKLEKTPITIIKSLIDSFNVSDERFIDNKYFAKFEINYNKKNTLLFFESKNIFPSIPNKLDILIIPILVNTSTENLYMYDENPIYKNWNNKVEQYYLLNYLLPNEDIEDRNFIKKNLESIEEYDFKEIIKKYDLNNHIIMIVFNDNNNLKVLSKINLNNDYKIINKIYESINLNDDKSLENFIQNIKNEYEDSWKNLNKINTSIKLPITVTIESKDLKKINLFENTLNNLDLVSDFYILSFNSNKILYKITYNGSPNKFLTEIKDNGLSIIKSDQNWKIK